METLIVRAAGSIVLTVRSTCFSTGTSMAGLAPGGGYVDVAGELVWAPPGVAASAVNTNPPARVRVVLLGACFRHPWRVQPPCQTGRQICREVRDPGLRGFTDPCEVALGRAGGQPVLRTALGRTRSDHGRVQRGMIGRLLRRRRQECGV